MSNRRHCGPSGLWFLIFLLLFTTSYRISNDQPKYTRHSYIFKQETGHLNFCYVIRLVPCFCLHWFIKTDDFFLHIDLYHKKKQFLAFVTFILVLNLAFFLNIKNVKKNELCSQNKELQALYYAYNSTTDMHSNFSWL